MRWVRSSIAGCKEDGPDPGKYSLVLDVVLEPLVPTGSRDQVLGCAGGPLLASTAASRLSQGRGVRDLPRGAGPAFVERGYPVLADPPRDYLRLEADQRADFHVRNLPACDEVSDVPLSRSELVRQGWDVDQVRTFTSMTLAAGCSRPFP